MIRVTLKIPNRGNIGYFDSNVIPRKLEYVIYDDKQYLVTKITYNIEKGTSDPLVNSTRNEVTQVLLTVEEVS